MNPVLYSGSTTGTEFLVPALLANETVYYWRVNSANICGPSAWSPVYDFKTMVCQSFMSTDVPVIIPANGSPTIISELNLPVDEEILDMNVISLTGTHSYMDDLIFSLIAPNNTSGVFWNRPCDSEDNFNIHFDDEAANSNWPCPPTNGMTYKPNNSFAPFNGLTTGGLWELEVEDIANHDGGSLNTWGLRVCWASVCELLVTQVFGSGTGTLANALNCSAPGDTVIISAALAGQTINVGNTPLQINKNVTILSQAPNVNITCSGTRPFEVTAQGVAEFNGMIITAGTSLTGGAFVDGRVARLSSAKAATAVRIRFRPQNRGAKQSQSFTFDWCSAPA